MWFRCWAGDTCHCPVWRGLCSLERQHRCGLGPVLINCSPHHCPVCRDAELLTWLLSPRYLPPPCPGSTPEWRCGHCLHCSAFPAPHPRPWPWTQLAPCSSQRDSVRASLSVHVGSTAVSACSQAVALLSPSSCSG